MADEYSDFKSPGLGDNILTQISEMALAQARAEEEVAKAQDILKEKQGVLRDITEHKFPELMDMAEQSKLTTKDGISVAVLEKIRASIPIAKAAEAFAWLEERNHSDLIKRQFIIEFGKSEDKWADKFERDCKQRKKPLNTKRKKTVHPATLASFIKEQLGEGEEIPLELFGAFRQRYTKITIE